MKKVLVVEDDLIIRDLFADLFRARGFDVTTADNGEDGWEKAQAIHPEFLFTGIDMPRMSGFDLIAKLRQDKNLNGIPAIIFSHLWRDGDREKATSFYNVKFKVKGYDAPADIIREAEGMLEPRAIPPSLAGSQTARSASVHEEDDRPPVNIL
jgi:CheY-like chemotaxis protein